jgi:hypothetical protein
LIISGGDESGISDVSDLEILISIGRELYFREE